MSNNNLYIVVLLTPFHVYQVKKIFDEYDNEFSHLIIFKTSIISDNEIKKNFQQYSYNSYNIGNNQFRLKKIIKSPFTEIRSLKIQIKDYEQIIKLEKIDHYKHIKLFFGNENDIFSQLLTLSLFKQKNVEFNAFDEGVGHYKSESYLDSFIRIISPHISNLFLSRKLVKYKVLGNAPFFSKIYLRFPEFKENTNNSIFLKINKDFAEKKSYTKSNKIIIFTSPIIEDMYAYQIEPIIFISELVDRLAKLGKNVYLKPHPRENIEKYDKLNKLTLLDNKLTAEKIDFFKYETILLFNSSIIIDLLNKNYPQKQVLNIKFNMKKRGDFIFFNKCHNFFMEEKSIDSIFKLLQNNA